MTIAVVASGFATCGEDVRALEAAAAPHADLIEVRADRWSEGGDALAGALARLSRPAIVAIRTPRDGGRFDGSEPERAALLRAAARGARYVDVELRSAVAALDVTPARRIVSSHDFEATPADLERRVAELRAAAPDAAFVKLATTPRSLADVARLVRLQRAQGGATPPLALFGLGELGLPTRLLAGRHGAPLVYASAPGREPTAPGQADARELVELYRVREQRPATGVDAVVGRPIAHSLSPRLHNTLDRRHAVDRVFVPLLAPTLDEALALADEIGIDGLSVTLPFKERAAQVARGGAPGFAFPPPEGAVNTLLRGDAGWRAANTDRVGFLAALERGAPELLRPGTKALVLGAGGVARTAVAALAGRGVVVVVASRTVTRARALAEALGATARELAPLDARALAEFALVVNATPVGMHPDEGVSPLPDGVLHRGQTVFDLVYRPRRTRLLAQALAAGARAIDGSEMFLAQALAQFALFTGRPEAQLDVALARATLAAALS